MPRDVEIRPNFFADTAYLLRLSHAIEKEDQEPETWRRETVVKIYELVGLLSEANLRKVERERKEL